MNGGGRSEKKFSEDFHCGMTGQFHENIFKMPARRVVRNSQTVRHKFFGFALSEQRNALLLPWSEPEFFRNFFEL
jgi:hypothetical protein